MNKAWRRQSSAEWASRAVTDQAWTTGWSRFRAHSNDEFEAAVAHATELHAEGELYSTCVEPEPAPEDPVEWAMAARRPNLRSSTCHRLRHPHLRCPTWSGASHCAWCTALDHAESFKKVSHVRRHVCPAQLPSHVSILLCVLPRLRTGPFFWGEEGGAMASNGVDTR